MPTILSSVQPIRGNLPDSAVSHDKLAMIAEAAPQGYGSVERPFGSPSSTGRGLMDDTRQATGHDWHEPFSDLVHANTDGMRAVADINSDCNDRPIWRPYGSNG